MKRGPKFGRLAGISPARPAGFEPATSRSGGLPGRLRATATCGRMPPSRRCRSTTVVRADAPILHTHWARRSGLVHSRADNANCKRICWFCGWLGRRRQGAADDGWRASGVVTITRSFALSPHRRALGPSVLFAQAATRAPVGTLTEPSFTGPVIALS